MKRRETRKNKKRIISFTKLKRPRYKVPPFVKHALTKNNVLEKYKKRPAYQQNDYIGWINRAKEEKTKEKRLSQMIKELKSGNKYMNMKYQPKN